MTIYDELAGYLRTPFYSKAYSSRHSAHESVKAQLYVLGFKLGYRSILEAAVCGSVRIGQIDCIFVDGAGRVVCGIEVDGTVRSKSVAKLYTLPADAEKIVVAFGSDAAWGKMECRTGNDTMRFGDVRFFRLHRHARDCW